MDGDGELGPPRSGVISRQEVDPGHDHGDHRRGRQDHLEGAVHDGCPPRAEHDPLTGSMGLVQDGIDNAIRQDIDPVRQVGGEEAVWIARRGHARCS